MDYGLWIMDDGLWIMDYGLWMKRVLHRPRVPCEDEGSKIIGDGLSRMEGVAVEGIRGGHARSLVMVFESYNITIHNP